MARKQGLRIPSPILPNVQLEACPVRASLGCLGRKWALIVLRDVALLRNVTFGQILVRNTGLTPRSLSMRLRELRKEGLIVRLADPEDGRRIRYRLTRQGEDAVPIVTAFIQYGIRHHATQVFADERPRDLNQVFPGEQAFLLGRLNDYALAGKVSSAMATTRSKR